MQVSSRFRTQGIEHFGLEDDISGMIACYQTMLQP